MARRVPKARSPEAEAQREHDAKVMAKMERAAKKRNAPYYKALKAAQARPPLVVHPQSSCAGEGQKIQTRTANGGIYTYESAGHKCPDLF